MVSFVRYSIHSYFNSFLGHIASYSIAENIAILRTPSIPLPNSTASDQAEGFIIRNTAVLAFRLVLDCAP
jgi:hypothetical protein